MTVTNADVICGTCGHFDDEHATGCARWIIAGSLVHYCTCSRFVSITDALAAA